MGTTTNTITPTPTNNNPPVLPNTNAPNDTLPNPNNTLPNNTPPVKDDLDPKLREKHQKRNQAKRKAAAEKKKNDARRLEIIKNIALVDEKKTKSKRTRADIKRENEQKKNKNDENIAPLSTDDTLSLLQERETQLWVSQVSTLFTKQKDSNEGRYTTVSTGNNSMIMRTTKNELTDATKTLTSREAKKATRKEEKRLKKKLAAQ